MTPEELYSKLQVKTGFETLNKTSTDKQIRIVGRVHSPSIPTWLQVVERLLLRSESSKWNADISKQYFMRGDKLLYGWRIIFQADDIVKYLPEIASTIDSTPMAMSTPTDEIPLHGNPNRYALNNGKGAQPMLTAKTMANR